MIKQPKINIIFDRRKKATSSIKSPLEIRVTYNYKQVYLSTGIMLLKNQWKNGNIVNCPDIIQISQTLDKLVSDIRQILFDMLKEDNVDINHIKNKLKEKEGNNTSFLQFCNKRVTIRKYKKSNDTQYRYDKFIRRFSKWGKIKEFEDITETNIIAYDRYLSASGMTSYSKWQNYHRFLNSFIIDAIDENLISKNPYKWLNIEKDKVNKALDKCLTPQEFKKLKKAKMPTECLERVRDLFIFQTYTCLRYSDMAMFNVNNIETVSGVKVYKCVQKKTSKRATIPLLKPALDILSKYHNVLPIISNVKYNAYLKVVAQAAGLSKPLTTHWARHTGATILLNEGISMQIVAKICGHSSTRITEEIYAKLLDETVINAIQSVKNRI